MRTPAADAQPLRAPLPEILGIAALEGRVARSFPLLLACLLAIALLARVAIALLAADIDPATSDMFEYGANAVLSLKHGAIVSDVLLADGRRFVYPTAFMPPLMIFFDMFWLWALGVSKVALAAIIGCNIVFGTLICFYTARIARTLFDSRVIALLAGLIVALHPVFVYSVATFHALNLYVLLLLVLFDLSSSRCRASPVNAIAVGVVLGVAVLARTEYLVLGPAIIATAALRHRRVALVALSLLVAALIVSPWTLRNYLVFQRFIPVVDSFGYNLCKSFNAETNGSGHWVDRNGVVDRVAGAQIAALPETPMYEVDRDAIYRAAARDYIRSHPWRSFVELPIQKALLFWLFDIYDSTTHKLLYQLSLWPTMTLSLLGFVYAWRRGWSANPDLQMIVAYFAAQTLVIAAYSVHARYRTNVEPFLFCFAALGLLLLVKWLRAWRTAPRLARSPA